MRKGHLFDGWTEGVINFPPTYKYKVNSEKYISDEPKSGRRTPAWYASKPDNFNYTSYSVFLFLFERQFSSLVLHDTHLGRCFSFINENLTIEVMSINLKLVVTCTNGKLSFTSVGVTEFFHMVRE